MSLAVASYLICAATECGPAASGAMGVFSSLKKFAIGLGVGAAWLGTQQVAYHVLDDSKYLLTVEGDYNSAHQILANFNAFLENSWSDIESDQLSPELFKMEFLREWIEIEKSNLHLVLIPKDS
jgi:hypothetical protein